MYLHGHMFQGEVCHLHVGCLEVKRGNSGFLIFILKMNLNSSTFSRFCMHEQTGTVVKIIWYIYLDTTGACVLS